MHHETVIQAPSAPPPVPGEARFARSIIPLAAAILVAMVLAGAALLVRGDPDEGARSDVLQTSQRFLVLLTTYNSTTLEAQRDQVLRLAAGRFRGEYSELTGADFLKALRERDADSKGRVTRVAVTSIEGDDATVLALVEVTTKNKDLPTPRVEQNLIELSLVRSGPGWRIDAVTILGTLG